MAPFDSTCGIVIKELHIFEYLHSKMSEYETYNKLQTLKNVFSYKRYFINNLDSYHGKHILLKISKITEKSAPSTITSAASVVGEDRELSEVPKQNNTYEIIGTIFK